MDNPYIVLGFGRSGTTWISDIISKMCGKLILFEPFHPSVTGSARDLSYSSIDNDINSFLAARLLKSVLTKRHQKPWLLRNHIPLKLDQISSNFVKMLWEQCNILGFKEIRANFMIDWLANRFDSKIVYIIRHPCAVSASIKKRTNFWEFGWPGTYELFLDRTIYNDTYRSHPIADRKKFVEGLRNDVEKYAAMWAITHAIALPIIEKLDLPLFFYEDFYTDPFSATRKLSSYLGNHPINIHPSHLFTPSMTTMKTFHGISKMETSITEKGSALFWDGTLSDREVHKILFIARMFGIELYDTGGYPHKHKMPSKHAILNDCASVRKTKRMIEHKQVIT